MHPISPTSRLNASPRTPPGNSSSSFAIAPRQTGHAGDPVAGLDDAAELAALDRGLPALDVLAEGIRDVVRIEVFDVHRHPVTRSL